MAPASSSTASRWATSRIDETNGDDSTVFASKPFITKWNCNRTPEGSTTAMSAPCPFPCTQRATPQSTACSRDSSAQSYPSQVPRYLSPERTFTREVAVDRSHRKLPEGSAPTAVSSSRSNAGPRATERVLRLRTS